MKSRSKISVLKPLSIACSAFVLSSAAMAGEYSSDEKKPMDDKKAFEHVNKTPYNMQHTRSESADKYWQDFKQDANQTWDNTKDAFRDGWMEGKLETAIMMNDRLNAFDIDIEVNDNKAILSGEVSSDVEKNLAESIAMGMDAIDSVDNRLTINKQAKIDEQSAGRSFSQYVKDASITAAIKTDLLADPDVAGLKIDVDTVNQKVVLSGSVDSKKEKELAGMIAKRTDDIHSFENRLVVERDS
ncbi:BON domain-containing protein [Teredinibacter turnerae]|uniref:BON domain-containing protein n=1 Tax=Teredinibacter turnerae TaxID=2426 RepID=UPI0030D2C5AA